ncbi:MAG: cold shock domain-containing protein [Clostridium sp.]|nr:cold shock domain-containing protein [Clostridium sp.]
MDFKTSKDPLTLYSNDVDLDNRWVVVNTKQMEEATKASWGWFFGVQSRRFERTKLHLVYDRVVGRPVIAKTICYRPDDLQSREAILERRSILTQQIDLLNDIASPLLPEPLDWFTVTNTVDGLPSDLRDSEPVLILDYQPGLPLQYFIQKKKLRFRQSKDREPGVDTTNVGRIAMRILYFIRILKEHNYAYLDLNPEHILLLNNYIPRFLGLGRICRTIDGHLDSANINFGMTSRGYSAPELNDYKDDWKSAKEATAEQIGAFSLGVIIHQMVSETTEFTNDMILNGSFVYPNGVTENIIQGAFNGDKLHELITMLCNHDVNERLTDLDVIEEKLKVISGVSTAKRRNIGDRKINIERKSNSEGKRNINRKVGWVKWYDQNRNFGFLVCKDTLKEYHISKTNLEKTNIAYLVENMRVTFEIVNGEQGDYATNVMVMQEPRRSYSPSMPRENPKPKQNDEKDEGLLKKLKKLFFS